MKTNEKYLENKCVECTTREQFIEVLKWHENMGHMWRDGDNPMNGIEEWDADLASCLDLFNGFRIADKAWNKEGKLTLLSFEEFKIRYCKVYAHKGHDGKYVIVGECKSKDILTEKWYDSVMYKKIDEETVYVREKVDFYEKFEVLMDGKDIKS